MGLLPTDFYNGTVSTSTTSTSSTTELLKDYLIDLDTGYLVTSDSGQFTIVTGLRAIIMQIWRKLHITQNTYLIYSSTYGNIFSDLIGKGKSYADAYAYTKLIDAIVDGTYVTKISGFSTLLSKASYTITFTINTIYGNTTEKLNIDLEG